MKTPESDQKVELTFLAHRALMNSFFRLMLSSAMSVKMEAFVKLHAADFAEIFLNFLQLFLDVRLHVLLQIVLEECAVRTRIAEEVFNVHVNFHDVSSPVFDHRATVAALTLRYRRFIFGVNIAFVNCLHVQHQSAIPRSFVVAVIALKFVLFEVDDVDVFFD